MTKLTEKQQAFVDAKSVGVPNRDAAVAAGYSPTAADVTAAKLMRRADIKSAIKAATKTGGVVIDKHTMPREKYADALQFMMDTMNHPQLPLAMRFEAAKCLMPYQHARVGEKGKKESAKDRAQALAGKQKFAPKGAPPSLRLV
jgi:phage terminase small subunit